jgi:ATP-binding cassette subfamily B protein
MLVTGEFVAAITRMVNEPPAEQHMEVPVLMVAGLTLGLGLLTIGRRALFQLSWSLDTQYSLEVHRRVAMASLFTPSMAPQEEPSFVQKMRLIEDAEQRGVLRQSVTLLTQVVNTRLRGIAVLAVLFAFRWWAPFILAVAWQLTNLLYLRTTHKGVTVGMSDKASQLQFGRAQYLRSLAIEPMAAKEVRIFGLADWLIQEYRNTWLNALTVMWQHRRANRALNIVAASTLGATHLIVLIALTGATTSGSLSLASCIVFLQALLGTSDLGLIGDSQWWLVQALAVAELAAGFPQYVDPNAHGGTNARNQRSSPSIVQKEPAITRCNAVSVRIEGVRFGYRGAESPAVDGLNLYIPAGQSIAIVGENGAGKSTLIDLLCGLHEPEEGSVTLDGVAPVDARRRIAVIFQDFVRYKMSLRDNVGFGHLPFHHETEILERALHDAGAGGILARLKNGLDTILSREFTDGATLSGGEWQRVALARALLAVHGGAGLLILDEPTASVDVQAESQLFDRILEKTRDVTLILVTHRLYSTRCADRIVVLHGGKIVEDGTHEQLMHYGGRYARMYSQQAQRFTATPCAFSSEKVNA